MVLLFIDEDFYQFLFYFCKKIDKNGLCFAFQSTYLDRHTHSGIDRRRIHNHHKMFCRFSLLFLKVQNSQPKERFQPTIKTY